MAVIAASCLALSMGVISNQHDYTHTATTNGVIKLGSGRYVKVNEWTSGANCVDLMVQYTDGTNTWESDNLVVADIGELTPFYFKSHGLPEREFSIAYTLKAGFTTCSIDFNARVKNPEQLSCVADADLSEQLQGGDAMAGRSDGGLPRHHQRKYVRESTTIPNNHTNIAAPEDADSNIKYFPLGSAPQVEIGCMQVYTTPSQFYTTAENPICRAELTKTDTPNVNHGIFVKDSYDCSAFTDSTKGEVLSVGLFGETEAQRTAYGSCCSQTTANSCHSVWTTTSLVSTALVRACFWVPSEESCYPEYSAHYVDVLGLVGLTDTVTFSSPEVYRPKSSYVTDPDIITDGYQGVGARKWFLMVQNNVATTFPTECGTTATVSFVSATTGGQCEPSSRRLCDNTHSSCMATPQDNNTALYWEAAKTGLDAIKDDKFHTCNCLKQKEVCYRKGGCVSTKKYQLVLQNCLDQGCGNYCNSGAGVVASLLVTVLAVLAVML